MADVIENPILNSPFTEPQRHFVFSETGITNEVAEARRVSAYFIPIPPPKKLGGQMALQVSWTSERVKPNDEINRIRGRVDAWRKLGYPGVTNITRGLLDYWHDPQRERPLFFCQVEALETAIYINEVASRHGDTWIENELREHNMAFNSGLPRVGIKMATGSGKTVVMAMIIAWQTLNKINHSADRRFSARF